MIDVPAYALVPGDILGRVPIATVRVIAPYSRQHAEVVVETFDGATLRLPAREAVRLTGRCLYAPEPCRN